MGRRISGKPKLMKGIAIERINILMNYALDRALDGDLKYADRYIELARKISAKYNVRIPRSFKRFICRGCKKILFPGKTLKVRFRKGKVVYRCLRCGEIKRYLLE